MGGCLLLSQILYSKFLLPERFCRVVYQVKIFLKEASVDQLVVAMCHFLVEHVNISHSEGFAFNY